MEHKPENRTEKQQVVDFIIDHLKKNSSKNIQEEKVVFAADPERTFDAYLVVDKYPKGMVLVENRDIKSYKNVEELFTPQELKNAMLAAEEKFGQFTVKKNVLGFPEILNGGKQNLN